MRWDRVGLRLRLALGKVRSVLLSLVRKWRFDDCTIGVMHIDGVKECFTLEDAVRPPGIKIMKRTAIPPGKYPVRVTWSPRFRRYLPILDNVPDFLGVRLHAGNLPSQTDGCILVGRKLGNRRILESALALERLYKRIVKAEHAGEGIMIEVSP